MASHRHFAAASSAVAALVGLSLVVAAGSAPVRAGAQPDAEAEPLARIESIIVNGAKRDQPSTNEVKVIHSATVVPALPSLSLFAGDEVITGVNVSVTLIMLEGAADQSNRVIIGPASQVSVRGQRSVFLSLGRLLADVRGFFDLLTLKATLAAKGTEFEVRVSEDETRLTVLEGVVDVVEAPPAVARRVEPALPFQFGLVRAAFRSGAPGFAASGQQGQPPPGGQPATVPAGPQRARRTITVTNRCKQRHLYDVEGPETLPWVHLFSAERIEVEGGQSRQVDIEIQFDPGKLAPGVYKGQGSVKCLDCFNEPGCTQSRDPVAIQVGLGTPAAAAISARAMEEVVIGSGGAARPARAQERACAAVNWTTDVIVAGQPTYSARHVVPQYESPEARGRAFREARDRALCRGEVEGYVALGHVYTDWGEGPKGVEAYTKVAAQPSRQNDAAFLARMAEAYRLKGQLDDAEAQTRRALTVDREAPSALVALGNVNLDRADIQSDLDQSQQFLRRAEDAYRQASGAPAAASEAAAQGVARANLGDVHVARGDIARERQQFDVARKEYAAADASFGTASTVYPRYAFARVGWGEAFRGLGEAAASQRNLSSARDAFARAEAQFRTGLENHPDLSDALVGLGDVYANQGRTKEAVETFARAVRARPTEPAGYYRLGVVLQNDNPALAARYLETHVKLKPAALRNAKTTRQAALMIPTLRGATTKVPDVRKLDEQAAQRKLSDAGLKGIVAERRSAPGQPPGLVIEHNPAAGAAVARGASVNLVVSAAPGPGGPGGGVPGVVPNVMARTEAEATALLTQAGYKVDVERKRRNDRPAGTVIRQRPEAGRKAKPGTEVRLEVAEAEAARPVSVPDIVGDDRARAVRKLQERRLQVGTITEQASCEDAGDVISQSPPEDRRVPAGTAVDFVVAGPGNQAARVPRLVGMRQNEAEDAIRESRLRVGRSSTRETDQQAQGTVLDQKPDANTVLAPGCPVEMTVAVPIPLVNVPNFIGMTEAEARRRLPGGVGGVLAELRLGEVTYQDAPYGIESRARTQITTPTVTGQSPSGGAQVRRGTAVNLVVLRPRQGGGGGTQDVPQPVQVPNVRGLTQAVAQRTLTAQGLTVGSVQEVQFRDAKEGTVVQQRPEAGAMVARGTRVDLAVARRADTRKPVPDVVGMPQRQAQATIVQYGFKVGSVTIAEDGRASGRVIRQSPAGNTPAPPGTAVNLVVSGLR